MNERIDVHHHILPPEYVATVGEKTIGAPAPNREVPKWDVAKSIEAMDRNGITSAVVSVSAPGVLLDDPAKTSRLARACNQFAAQMVADHPTRYGLFASLPLPDTEEFVKFPGARYIGSHEHVPLLPASRYQT